MRMKEDDWGDGLDDNGGNPKSVQKTWIDINWTFPVNAPNPDSFSVVAFIGSDPTDATTYLFEPVIVPGTDRRLVVSINPNVAVTGINPAVRANYA